LSVQDAPYPALSVQDAPYPLGASGVLWTLDDLLRHRATGGVSWTLDGGAASMHRAAAPDAASA
jgi:hypothetical protein